MATKVKEQEKDLFADVKEVTTDDELIIDHDDLKEGIMAESDPATKLLDPLAAHKGEAADVVKQSLDGQLTALGRKTAELLKQCPKHKVVIPFKELNPDDDFVVVGINGWNLQIKRGVPVMLPDEVIHALSVGGESPTLVR